MKLPQSVDANASGPVLAQAWDAYVEASEDFADAAAPHVAGRAAQARLEAARAQVGACLNAEPDEIHFTSGGTEADAWALGGVLAAAAAGHCVVSSIEHAAVAQALKQAAQVTRVAVPRTGLVDVAAMRQAMRPDTRLVTLLAASNETGVVQPVAEVAAAARSMGAHMHTDAVQAVGRMPVDVRAWGVESLALAGHKLGAVGGTGVLFIRRGLTLPAPWPRTEAVNVPGAASLAAALAHRPSAAQLQALARQRDAFETQLLAQLPHVEILGRSVQRLPNTSCLRQEGCPADGVLMALDLQGFAVSTGSACSSGSIEPSPVLLGMGLSAREAREAVRFSFHPGVDDEAVVTLVAQLVRVVQATRGRVAR